MRWNQWRRCAVASGQDCRDGENRDRNWPGPLRGAPLPAAVFRGTKVLTDPRVGPGISACSLVRSRHDLKLVMDTHNARHALSKGDDELALVKSGNRAFERDDAALSRDVHLH